MDSYYEYIDKMNHQCEICQHVFSQKAGLTAHRNRKRPCKAVSQSVKAVEAATIAPVAAAVPIAVPVTAAPKTIPLDWINQVQLGDCIAYMKQLPANSIDMVCTDPPYFLDGLGSDWNKESLDQKGSSSRVGNLPKGMKFDRNQSKKFHAFYTQVSAEIFRVLKPGGAFLSFSSPRLYHSMAWAMEEAGFEIRDMLGWIYTQAQVKAFSQDHIIDKDKTKTDEEKTALKELCKDWKTPQLKPAIEPICLAVKPIEGRYIDNFEKYGTGLMNTSEETKVGDDYFPSNIIVTEPVGNLEKVFLVSKPSKAEKGTYNTHLSVKPVALIQHLMTLFTKEGALILDPFMGSGTTALACIESNRRYMGFDINEEYIKITERRIKELRPTGI
jgi:site-specific DNA-methyltransferase (adenine-specific)